METILERVQRSRWWKFHGGIHPPEQKFLTNDKPIRNLPLPELLKLPLKQHIGQKGELIVNVGDKVLKGQALTNSQHPMAVPIHAPTSGKVIAIKNAVVAHPSGLSELCLFLQPDGKEQWRERNICQNIDALSQQDVISKIVNAGIAGMGGAGFPTNVKVNIKNNTSTKIKCLIINAAECEPYITADDLLIREHSSEIIDGVKILANILKPEQVLIGIEDNKPAAIKALQQAITAFDNFHVCILPTKYPSGGEKQLIKILTGLEVPQGGLPSALGIVVQNVATCFAIADAIINDTPLIRRVVTVTGNAVNKPQNVWALLGTPIKHLLQHCHYQAPTKEHLILGGPMMGYSLPSSDISITKTTNCILAPSSEEIPNTNNEVDCIRCGQCADVCPSQLLPQELQWFAKANDHQQLQKFDLFDCIECGACAYVCPSQIPLVHYYRIAKAEIRQQQLQDLKAEKAKARFEARKLRLEKEKIKREEKHRKAAEARKAMMNSNSGQAKGAKSAVAAALARAKAKKAQLTSKTGDIKNTASDNDSSFTNSSTTNETNNDKKLQVAAAIARAKAKKQAKAISSDDNQAEKNLAHQSLDNNKNTATNSKIKLKSAPKNDTPLESTPKTRAEKIALAVAKAKSRKIKTAVDDKKLSSGKNINTDKKQRIAAAVAKAKLKKQQQNKPQIESQIELQNNQSKESS